MSEDSDYTSDINYPLSHQHNSSAHQFRGEPNFPLQHDHGREYNHDYDGYGRYDPDEVDDYDRRRDFDHLDSYDRQGWSGPEDQRWSDERPDSIERTESFEQEYGEESDQYGYVERSDTEYEPSLQGDQYDDRDEYGSQNRDYDRQSQHSSNRDYDSERDDYSHEDYDRTITNDDCIRADKNKHYDTGYDRRYDSPDRYSSRNGLRDIRDAHTYSRDPDYVTGPNYVGRSDTDSEIMSYNSRPPRAPVSAVASSYQQG